MHRGQRAVGEALEPQRQDLAAGSDALRDPGLKGDHLLAPLKMGAEMGKPNGQKVDSLWTTECRRAEPNEADKGPFLGPPERLASMDPACTFKLRPQSYRTPPKYT